MHEDVVVSILCIVNNLEHFSGQWDALNRLHAAKRKFDLALVCLPNVYFVGTIMLNKYSSEERKESP
jgi:hypothetical protein